MIYDTVEQDAELTESAAEEHLGAPEPGLRVSIDKDHAMEPGMKLSR